MGLLDFLNPIAKIVDIGAGIGNFFEGLASQDWMKEAQKTTWEREDTAVQRRVADLKAAGLSPVLAAGSSASTSSPIQIGTPQIPTDNFQKLNMASALMQQKKDFEQADSSIALNHQLREKAVSDTDYNRQATDNLIQGNLESQARTQESNARQLEALQRIKEAKYNLTWFQDHKIPTNVPEAGNTAYSADMIDRMFKNGAPVTAGALQLLSKVAPIVLKAFGR